MTIFGQLYLAVAQPVVIAVVVRLAVEGRGVPVIVVDQLEVVEAVADALRAEVPEQLQPHAALHHAGGVAGALALAAGLGADGDGLDAGGVLGTAVNRTSRRRRFTRFTSNMDKEALVGAFSGHCKISRDPDESYIPG